MSAEQSSNPDERQPLLQSTHDQEVVERKTDLWKTLWYTVIILAALALLALLIRIIIGPGDVEFDLKKALKSALGGGLAGAAAMVLQVLTLMPLRTVMNYQYRYGSTTTQAVKTLYNDGGYSRYYQGLTPALVQGPVSRFGDTFANVGILALFHSNPFLNKLPVFIQSVFASLLAAGFRMILTPIDTLKTTMQTEGKTGLQTLKNRVKKYGVGSMWYGAFATAAATFVGHYPWFGTYNTLQANIPIPDHLAQKLFRQAFIGFCASVVSDTVSNSLRVVKTYRQVHESNVGYVQAAKAVVAQDGLKGLFGRGLKTRIIANGCQGIMFSVLWKLFLDLWNAKT